MATSTLEIDSMDACTSALRKYGFLPRRRGLFLQSRTDKSATGWLGLNLATWALPAKVQVNPVVGVRHRALEQALAELAQRKAPTPSVSRPLGYLMPQNTFVQWDFQRDGDLVAVAEDLAEAVATYGQPFIDKWSDWQVFSAEIAESRLLLNDEKFFVLPVVAALSGDRFTADELVRRELERVGTSDDAYSKAYRQFAERFAAQSF